MIILDWRGDLLKNEFSLPLLNLLGAWFFFLVHLFYDQVKSADAFISTTKYHWDGGGGSLSLAVLYISMYVNRKFLCVFYGTNKPSNYVHGVGCFNFYNSHLEYLKKRTKKEVNS